MLGLLHMIWTMPFLRQGRRRWRSDEVLTILTQRAIHSEEEERRHIACELHDDVGQRLSLLSFHLHTINAQLKNNVSSHQPTLDEPLQELSELITDIHKLSHRLHSARLEHLGLRVAMKELCQTFSQQHHMEIDLRADEIPDSLPQKTALALYRVAQESLNNAAKHSGSNVASVTFQQANGKLTMKIADMGKGFDPSTIPIGLGFTTMTERIRMVEGDFSVQSKLALGTTITAAVPFPQA